MTRKDYVLLAKAITDTRHRIGTDQSVRIEECPAMQRGVRRTAAHICDALAADNPRFDPAQFLKACGYGATTMIPHNSALDLRPLPDDETVGTVTGDPHSEDETDAQCERKHECRRSESAIDAAIRDHEEAVDRFTDIGG